MSGNIIQWTIPESTWTQAARILSIPNCQESLDPHRRILSRLFGGYLQIRYLGVELFPIHELNDLAEKQRNALMTLGDPFFEIDKDELEKGVWLNIGEFALWMHSKIMKSAFLNNVEIQEVHYKEDTNPLIITFAKSGGLVLVRSNLLDHAVVSMPGMTFLGGVLGFLGAITMEISQRHMQLLEWHTFSDLNSYRR